MVQEDAVAVAMAHMSRSCQVETWGHLASTSSPSQDIPSTAQTTEHVSHCTFHRDHSFCSQHEFRQVPLPWIYEMPTAGSRAIISTLGHLAPETGKLGGLFFLNGAELASL